MGGVRWREGEWWYDKCDGAWDPGQPLQFFIYLFANAEWLTDDEPGLRGSDIIAHRILIAHRLRLGVGSLGLMWLRL